MAPINISGIFDCPLGMRGKWTKKMFLYLIFFKKYCQVWMMSVSYRILSNKLQLPKNCGKSRKIQDEKIFLKASRDLVTNRDKARDWTSPRRKIIVAKKKVGNV